MLTADLFSTDTNCSQYLLDIGILFHQQIWYTCSQWLIIRPCPALVMYILRRVAENTLIIQSANVLFFSVCPFNIRNQPALLRLFHRYVAPGTTIITDKWRGNIILGNHGYSHEDVNHSTNWIHSAEPILTGLKGPGPDRQEKQSFEARRTKNSWKFGSFEVLRATLASIEKRSAVSISVRDGNWCVGFMFKYLVSTSITLIWSPVSDPANRC